MTLLECDQADPEEDVPVRLVVVWCLNAIRTTFSPRRAVAFCPAISCRVDFSNDPLLQGRLFSYLDTQNRGWGLQISIRYDQRAEVPIMNFQRDGQMQMKCTGRANYERNLAAHGKRVDHANAR